MPPPLQSAIGLREKLLAVVKGVPSPAEMNALVRVSLALALASLRSKRSSEHAALMEGISSTDLAYDCIADLFQKDANGTYIRLRAYFGSLDLENSDGEELLVHLRRLVSSAVNQGLFRVFNDIDPALGKILRNIKLSIHVLRNFDEIEIFGEPCIAPVLCDTLGHLKQFEWEQVSRLLMNAVRGDEKLPEILAALSSELRSQDELSRIVPLMAVGLAVRDVYARKRIAAPEWAEMELNSPGDDMRWAIEKACGIVRAKTEKRYLAKGKVTKELLDLYFLAIKNHFLGRIDGGIQESLHENLKKVTSDSVMRNYAHEHRARIEYLARLVQNRALKLINR